MPGSGTGRCDNSIVTVLAVLLYHYLWIIKQLWEAHDGFMRFFMFLKDCLDFSSPHINAASWDTYTR